jgi:hypothetical protein
MDRLTDVVRDVVFWYAGGGFDLRTYAMVDEAQHAYSVISVSEPVGKFPSSVIVLARILDNLVIIEEDTTDRPLLNKLLEAGIPRHQIVCANEGEAIPMPA